MCGIAGIVALPEANRHAVERMNELQHHRGPDGAGIWSSPSGEVVLGHRRLSIIDTSLAAAQPMAANGMVITFNGEIYNYVELAGALKARGHSFNERSDTAVLLHAYMEWGPKCLERLNGMFAFAIWDEHRKQLFCARDRYGEKPFLYSLGASHFAFASEAKALTALSEVSCDIHRGVVHRYVAYGATSVDSLAQTLYAGVQQLLPAHYMIVSLADGAVRVNALEEYWSIAGRGRAPAGSGNLAQSAEELRTLLTDSVRLRLRSDVATGSCLSGGLDSSTIVSLIRRLEPGTDLRTFTGRFPGSPKDEGYYANLVVQASHTTSAEVAPAPDRFIREAERIYWHADFPLGGLSQFAQWCVFHLASEHEVTVLLDGQGSDEMFGGYGWQIAEAYLRQLWAEGKRGMWLAERAAWAEQIPQLFSWPRLALNAPPLRVARRVMRRMTNRSQLTTTSIVRRDWLDAADDSPLSEAPVPSAGDRNALSELLYALSFRTMLSGLLRYGDRLSMAHSREVRLPFCDHRIAELAFSMAPELLVGRGTVKRVLRAAATGVVPDEIVTRRKQGFVPPEEEWLAGDLSGLIGELAAAAPSIVGDVLDVDRIRALAASAPEIRRRETTTLWHALNLLAWGTFAAEPMRTQAKQSVFAA